MVHSSLLAACSHCCTQLLHEERVGREFEALAEVRPARRSNNGKELARLDLKGELVER
jgi:hypothetical protein